ncbi:MAG: hypothetical protein HYR62_06785 [Actinobacteria bacterium]|nr:hypothetical protein [Actinomycetota bacterium]MBI3688289.1 hypothetical protein [Actinomycetota bacterium]
MQSGTWTFVVMNTDGGSGIAVRADAAATVPALGWLSATLLVAGLVLLAAGTVVIVLAVTPSIRARSGVVAAPTGT